MALLDDEDDYEVAVTLVLGHWRSFMPNFIDYFEKQFVDGWRRNFGFAYSIPDLTRSNGNCEGFNYYFNKRFLDDKRLSLHRFLPVFFSAI